MRFNRQDLVEVGGITLRTHSRRAESQSYQAISMWEKPGAPVSLRETWQGKSVNMGDSSKTQLDMTFKGTSK